jgi:hypothetical protein
VTDQPDHASSSHESAPAELPAPPEPDAEPQPAAEPQRAAEPQQVHLRRAPRYRAFVITGAVVGLVVAFVLSRSTGDAPQFSGRSVLGYLVVILGLIGAVIGGGLAVLAERPRRGGR